MQDLVYSLIKEDVENGGKIRSNGTKEILGYHFKVKYPDFEEFKKEIPEFKKAYEEAGGDWEYKQMMEEQHYKKLEGSLLHAINENKYYLKENLFDSRRFISLSTDCISNIQLIFREDEVFLGVYFRSSEINNLLPVDLDFLYGLVQKAIQYVERRAGTDTYEEINPKVIEKIKNSKFVVDLSFGSLHERL